MHGRERAPRGQTMAGESKGKCNGEGEDECKGEFKVIIIII